VPQMQEENRGRLGPIGLLLKRRQHKMPGV
jgi:hypothetical protein